MWWCDVRVNKTQIHTTLLPFLTNAQSFFGCFGSKRTLKGESIRMKCSRNHTNHTKTIDTLSQLRTLFGLSLHINRFACGFECSCYNLTNIYTSTTSLDFILAFVCSYVRMFAETLLNCCDHLHPSYFILLCYPYLSSTATFGGVDLASIYSLFILCGFFRRLLFELPFIFVWCRTLYLSICVLFQFWWFLLAVMSFLFLFLFYFLSLHRKAIVSRLLVVVTVTLIGCLRC